MWVKSLIIQKNFPYISTHTLLKLEKAMSNRFSLLGTTAAVLALVLGSLVSGCKEDSPTGPSKPSVTDEELAEVAAAMLGESTGGFRLQALDMLAAAQGDTIKAAARKTPGPEVLKTKAAHRSADATIDGGRYAYDYNLTYTYSYTADGFPRGDGEKLDSLVNGIHFSYTMKGTHDAPNSKSSDTGYTNVWDVRRLIPDTSLFSITKGTYERVGTETLKATNKTINRTATLRFRYVRINPRTKTIKSDETNDATFYTEFVVSNVTVGSDTTLIRDNEGYPKTYNGIVFFKEDGTATLKLNGKDFTIDVAKGIVKK